MFICLYKQPNKHINTKIDIFIIEIVMYLAFIFGSDDISFPSSCGFTFDQFDDFINDLESIEIIPASFSIDLENKELHISLENPINYEQRDLLIVKINELLALGAPAAPAAPAAPIFQTNIIENSWADQH